MDPSSNDRSRVWDLVSVLVLVAIAIAQLWPGLSHDLSPPITWDHGSHLGKAILTWEMLPSLRGWTDLVENGVPLNTVYTATGTLLILVVRVFTQHLAWTQTYAIAIVVFRVLVALSVYRLARVLRAGVLGSMIAGVIYLADFGDHSEGGWFYEVQYGVWPMSLAIAAFFVGIADLLEFLDGGAKKHASWAMLWIGVALFSHQATLLAIGSVLPALVLVRMTSTETDLRADLRKLIPILGVAGLISLWWLLPMFGFTAWLDDHGQLYAGTPDIGHRFLTGEGILRGGHWTSVLTALGLGYGLFTGEPRRRALAGAALVAMILGSPGWLLGPDMLRIMPSLGRIVFPRMMTIAKPIAFALAGVVLGDLAQRLWRSQERWLGTTRGKLGLALSLAALAPFLVRAPEAFSSLVIEREYTSTNTLGEWSSWQDAWRWVRERRVNEDRDAGFYRVFWFHEGTHLGQASPAYTHVPGHITGVLVGEAFRNTSDGTDPDALRAINVRYVVGFADLPFPLRSETTLLTTLGQARIYELQGWSSETVSDLDGDAHPVVEHYETSRVVFRPNGAREVVVRRAYAPPMHAYADGHEIPIALERVVDSPHLRLMRLAIPDGTERVEVRYEGLGARGVLGWLGTLLGLAIVLAYALEDRWPPRVRALRSRLVTAIASPWRRVPERPRLFLSTHWAHLALVLPVLGFALLTARALRGYHVAYHLDEVSMSHRASSDAPIEPCTGGAPHCVEAGVSLAAEPSCVDGWFRSCISSGPPSHGVLVVELPHAPTTGTLELGAGVSDDAWQRGDGAPITVRAFAGEADLGTLEIPNGRHWESASYPLSGQGPLRLEIDGGAPGRHHFCFDAIIR
ncbi:MAG: 6-pyruvoyl-tetrahydropterin synthase-related protein [Sandaracinus sp.]